MCDVEAVVEKKAHVDEVVKANEVEPSSLPKNVENTAKRKYCASESNEYDKQTIEERKKVMIKKLKTNSLFKF